ncbi:hypothetical protein [Cryptosporangium phraense]|uniref:Uncharacterized protein n=1 Tax=Cryptosporangium phraense TaxID=2593070 RepID=A0A545AY44_9ACTN|nr:hypothetical protein [Cryptosporangium phraense]TQS45485.1 hypothetical protein FL583_07010 [Cryptosporangium phraense]
MVFRRLLAAVAASLLLIGLSSCKSDPTVAAYVGDDVISIDQIDDYYAKAVADPVSAQQVQQNPGAAKPNLVSMLVFIQLLHSATEKVGAAVTPAEVSAAKAELEPQRQQITGELALLPLDQLADILAYQGKLGDWAKEGVADQNSAAKKYTQALQDAEKANPVTVNPRYGKFDLNKAPQMVSSDVAVKSVQS